MNSIVSRNIRGLNWPNKQEDIRPFLHNNKVGLLGLLETKVKKEEDNKVAARTFPRWMWQHNSTPNIKGRIWIAWKQRSYKVKVLKKIEHLMQCYTTQLSTNKKFYITFVYGMNQEQQRQHL